MSAEDYFDWGSVFDQMDECYGDGDGYYRRGVRHVAQPKTCYVCGKTNLYWLMIKGKWRLGYGGTEHVCVMKPMPFFKPREGKLFK